MIKNNYFILTGAMGAGKSAVLNEIKKQNYICIDEPARIVLKEQREINGEGVPEKNATVFNQLMLDKMISQYKTNININEPVIFDRGIADIIAYSQLLNTNEDESTKSAKEYRYNKNVFMFNGWNEIYTTDDERIIGFDEANNFGLTLKRIYESLDYQIIEVPFTTIDKRGKFIISKINEILR
ncbi:MAG: AAA family ATPase [Bacteroidetes bacterium]|nr:AAA family ATPase [Bacteroidota bacterium]